MQETRFYINGSYGIGLFSQQNNVSVFKPDHVFDSAYNWDNNGDLLNDGANTYTYDFANRLTTLTSPTVSTTYSYNGLGNRLQQTMNGASINYTLDLNAGLTQILSDGTYSYTYGVGRISQ